MLFFFSCKQYTGKFVWQEQTLIIRFVQVENFNLKLYIYIFFLKISLYGLMRQSARWCSPFRSLFRIYGQKSLSTWWHSSGETKETLIHISLPNADPMTTVALLRELGREILLYQFSFYSSVKNIHKGFLAEYKPRFLFLVLFLSI